MSDDMAYVSGGCGRMADGIGAVSSDITHVSFDIAQMPVEFFECLKKFVLGRKEFSAVRQTSG
jgi:hypothetical protein